MFRLLTGQIKILRRNVFSFSDAIKDIAAWGLEDMVKRGIGFYLMILSAIGLLAAPYVQKYLKK